MSEKGYTQQTRRGIALRRATTCQPLSIAETSPLCLHSKGAAGHHLGPLTLLGDLAGNKQQVAQQLLLALRGLGQLGQAVARLWNDKEVRGGLHVQPLGFSIDVSSKCWGRLQHAAESAYRPSGELSWHLWVDVPARNRHRALGARCGWAHLYDKQNLSSERVSPST